MGDVDAAELERLRAQLELARELQGFLVHELGNPLQSASMMVELGVDELRSGDPQGTATSKLERGLESIERLRDLHLRIGGVRALLGGRRSPVESSWGRVLDEFAGLLCERLVRGRLSWERDTTAIDAMPMPTGALREATLTLLLGACESARDARLTSGALVLLGERDDPSWGPGVALRMVLRTEERTVPLGDAAIERARVLLSGEHARCEPRDGGWLLWAA